MKVIERAEHYRSILERITSATQRVGYPSSLEVAALVEPSA